MVVQLGVEIECGFVAGIRGSDVVTLLAKESLMWFDMRISVLSVKWE